MGRSLLKISLSKTLDSIGRRRQDVGRFARFQNENDLGNFPLVGEVSPQGIVGCCCRGEVLSVVLKVRVVIFRDKLFKVTTGFTK
jgi:hypothetical protein